MNLYLIYYDYYSIFESIVHPNFSRYFCYSARVHDSFAFGEYDGVLLRQVQKHYPGGTDQPSTATTKCIGTLSNQKRIDLVAKKFVSLLNRCKFILKLGKKFYFHASIT